MGGLGMLDMMQRDPRMTGMPGMLSQQGLSEPAIEQAIRMMMAQWHQVQPGQRAPVPTIGVRG